MHFDVCVYAHNISPTLSAGLEANLYFRVEAVFLVGGEIISGSHVVQLKTLVILLQLNSLGGLKPQCLRKIDPCTQHECLVDLKKNNFLIINKIMQSILNYSFKKYTYTRVTEIATSPIKPASSPCCSVTRGSLLDSRALIHSSCTGHLLDLVDGD